MPDTKLSRRLVVGVIGAGLVAAPLLAHAAAPPASVGGSTPRSLLGSFEPGSRFGRWTIVSVGELELGALRVIVKGDEQSPFALEILARDQAPLAPAPPSHTERFAVHVANGGDGWHATVEEQGLAAMALADIVAAHEQSVDATGFLTHAERQSRHAERMSTSGPSAGKR